MDVAGRLNKARPARIGIFDSGLGGLTIWAAIRRALPQADLSYLADQAKVPYGPRRDEDIRQLCQAQTTALLNRGCELIVLACNTASAAALEFLRQQYPDTPFVGMEPAVKPAALQTRSGIVGLMATEGTLRGALLRSTAARFAGHVEIVPSECAGLAEAIERQRPEADILALLHEHLRAMRLAGADIVVLGCTHYPLVLPLIAQVMGPGVALIDPAPAVARQTARLWRKPAGTGSQEFLTTGRRADLQAFLARRYALDAPVQELRWDGETLTEMTPQVR